MRLPFYSNDKALYAFVAVRSSVPIEEYVRREYVHDSIVRLGTIAPSKWTKPVFVPPLMGKMIRDNRQRDRRRKKSFFLFCTIMDGRSIISLLKEFEKNSVFAHFSGVLSVRNFVDPPISEIKGYDPNKICIFILNTADSPKEMGHWLGFFCRPGSDGFFIDSFGLGPAAYAPRFPERLKALSATGKFQSIPFQLQQRSTYLCALYVIYFAIQFLALKAEFQLGKEFLKREFGFRPRQERANDERILGFFQKRYGTAGGEVFSSEVCLGGAHRHCISLAELLNGPISKNFD